MRYLLLILFFCLGIYSAKSQRFGGSKIDSLLSELKAPPKSDQAKVDVLNELSLAYFFDSQQENALLYATQARDLAAEIAYKTGEAIALRNRGNHFYSTANYEMAIEQYKKSLEISEEIDYDDGIAAALGNIGGMYNELSNYREALTYYQRSLELYQKNDDRSGMGSAYNNIGLAYVYLSDYPKAIDAFQNAIQIGEKIKDKPLMVKGLNNMGFLYSNLQDYEKSLTYAQRAREIYRETGNQRGESYALNNLGIITAKMSDSQDPKALEYYEQSLSLAQQVDDRMLISMVLGSIGEFYFNTHDFVKALDYSRKSLEISKQIGDKTGMAYEFNNVASSYLKLPDSLFPITLHPLSARNEIALKYADSALVINQEIGSVSGQKNAWKTLTDIHLENQDYKNAYTSYFQYVLLNDSIQGEEVKNNILRKELEFDYEKRTAIAREEQEKRNITQRNIRTSLVIGLVGLIFFSGLLTRQRNKLKIEKRRSENLLLNILPIEVAEELKQTGRAKARKYENISILFTDFVNFTKISENLTPEVLIEELNECFTAFDHIMEKHGLEKIKTIGDAYMAVCGLPISMPDHAQRTVRAALDIADYIRERGLTEKVFDIRIGINSGPVVAGIVGVKKFAYDIWGDSVNIAARIEQNGAQGRVNISASTFKLVQQDFDCHYRGEIEAKNKGKLKMYFVERKKIKKEIL